MVFSRSLFGCFAIFVFGAVSVNGSSAYIRLPHQEGFYLDVEKGDTVANLKEVVEEVADIPSEDQLVFFEGRFLEDEELVSGKEELWIELPESDDAFEEQKPKKTYVGYRNYQVKLSSDDQKDIRFILKSLAKKSLVQLYRSQSQLEAAGDRIDHVHPLSFLLFIFTDEELKAYMQAIKKRGGWVWGEFMGGLKESLREESDLQNLTDEMINDFSNKIGIGTKLIYTQIRDYRWDEFVKVLINNIPRNDDSGRYDM